jgi:large subunit ribosomal protein L18
MNYTSTLKRIRKHKTNYRKRAALLIGRHSFITIKLSDQNVAAQVLRPTPSGDIVMASAHSRELRNLGWKGSLNNLPACYLTGLVLGKKILERGTQDAVLYTGKDQFTTRVAACLKGIVEAGVNIPVSEESLPDDFRISGQHISEYAKLLSSDKTKYSARFSQLLKEGLNPEDYPSHFEEIRMKLSGKPRSKVAEVEQENPKSTVKSTSKAGDEKKSRTSKKTAKANANAKSKASGMEGKGSKSSGKGGVKQK